MSNYKTDQHHLVHRGRSYHFVSYEARPANPRTGEAAVPASWYLMCAGKRWQAIDQAEDQSPETAVSALTRWLDEQDLVESATGQNSLAVTSLSTST